MYVISLLFLRNHLKNTFCDVGFLNKYYYQSINQSIRKSIAEV